MSIKLTGKQIKDLLEHVCPDKNDPDQLETEITLFEIDKPFISIDGDKCTAGPYFYFSEYQEEGCIGLAQLEDSGDE